MRTPFHMRRVACCLLSAGAVALAAGCEEREPPKPQVADARVQGLLENMNAFARETPAEREFRYALSADCTLTAERVVSGRPGQRRTVPLGSTAFTRFEYAPGLGYGLRAPIAGTSAMESIFDAGSIERIETMEALLRSLESTCLQVAAGTRSDSDARYAYGR